MFNEVSARWLQTHEKPPSRARLIEVQQQQPLAATTNRSSNTNAGAILSGGNEMINATRQD